MRERCRWVAHHRAVQTNYFYCTECGCARTEARFRSEYDLRAAHGAFHNNPNQDWFRESFGKLSGNRTRYCHASLGVQAGYMTWAASWATGRGKIDHSGCCHESGPKVSEPSLNLWRGAFQLYRYRGNHCRCPKSSAAARKVQSGGRSNQGFNVRRKTLYRALVAAWGINFCS